MKEFCYTITAPDGIHVRPAGKLVKETAKYQSDIILEKKRRTADAKRIFAVMGLAIKHGDSLTVKVNGEDEEIAVQALETFFKSYL